jgi:hypothetical protein
MRLKKFLMGAGLGLMMLAMGTLMISVFWVPILLVIVTNSLFPLLVWPLIFVITVGLYFVFED